MLFTYIYLHITNRLFKNIKKTRFPIATWFNDPRTSRSSDRTSVTIQRLQATSLVPKANASQRKQRWECEVSMGKKWNTIHKWVDM